MLTLSSIISLGGVGVLRCCLGRRVRAMEDCDGETLGSGRGMLRRYERVPANADARTLPPVFKTTNSRLSNHQSLVRT